VAGNVRELENVVRRFLILPDVAATLAILKPSRVAAPVAMQERASLKKISSEAVEHVERELVLRTLAQTNWNRKRAAKELGICYKALLNKLKKWEIDERGGKCVPLVLTSLAQNHHVERACTSSNWLVQAQSDRKIVSPPCKGCELAHAAVAASTVPSRRIAPAELARLELPLLIFSASFDSGELCKQIPNSLAARFLFQLVCAASGGRVLSPRVPQPHSISSSTMLFLACHWSRDTGRLEYRERCCNVR